MRCNTHSWFQGHRSHIHALRKNISMLRHVFWFNSSLLYANNTGQQPKCNKWSHDLYELIFGSLIPNPVSVFALQQHFAVLPDSVLTCPENSFSHFPILNSYILCYFGLVSALLGQIWHICTKHITPWVKKIFYLRAEKIIWKNSYFVDIF